MKGSIQRKKVPRSEPKIAMYPKVRVPCHVKEDEDEARYQTQRDSSLDSNDLHSPFSISENNEEDDSQVFVAKIPKVYLPSVSATCISDVIKGSTTDTNKRDTKPLTQKTKATPIQRPRAIVSSPDNDAMIGSINKIEERKKKKGLKE